MAIDSYMIFVRYGDKPLEAESQVVLGSGPPEPLATDGGFDFSKYVKGGNVFEVEEYSFDVEQTLNIGSQSRGAGAGKITFNPFSISRKIDKSSPIFFEMACSGTAFPNVFRCRRKGAGADTNQSGQIFLRFDFKLVAVKTISWSHDEVSPKEEVTFEYGGLQVRYCVQNPNGSMGKVIGTGWNLVQNKSDVTITPIS